MANKYLYKPGKGTLTGVLPQDLYKITPDISGDNSINDSIKLLPSHLAFERVILQAGVWDVNIREIGNILELPDGRLILSYTGTTLPYTEGVSEFVGAAISTDKGQTWSKIGAAGKILTTNSEDPYMVLNPSTNQIHLFVEKKVSSFPGFHAGIELFTADLVDLNTWTSQGVILSENPSNPWEAQDVSSPTIVIKDGVWNMYYEGRGDASQAGTINLATSLDGINFTKSSSNPLIYGSQYDNTSPTSAWFTHCVPDDIKIIDGDLYLTAHCFNGFTFSEALFKSDNGIDWLDCLGTWITRSDNDENLGNGLMFFGKNKGLYNNNTQLLIGTLTYSPFDKFIYNQKSSATGIFAIKSGNKNEIINLSITSNSSIEIAKGFLNSSGVLKIIKNPTAFTATISVGGSGTIDGVSSYILSPNTSVLLYSTGINTWGSVAFAGTFDDSNLLHKTGDETKNNGSLKFTGDTSEFNITIKPDNITLQNLVTTYPWARDILSFTKNDNSGYFSFGAFGNMQTLNYGYIGFGNTPVDGAIFKFTQSGIGINLLGGIMPSYPLDVNGNARFNGTVIVSDAVNTNEAVNLGQLQNGYIPLSGTLPSKPMTGNFEITNTSKFITPDTNKELLFNSIGVQMLVKDTVNDRISAVTSTESGFDFYHLDNSTGLSKRLLGQNSDNRGIVIIDEIDNVGLTGENDYSTNYTPLSYVQKLYVDGLAVNTITSDTNVALSIPYPARIIYYSYTGTLPSIWTLPAITGNTKARFILINTGTGTVDVESNTGDNDIWDSGTLVNTINLPAGSSMEIYNNGNAYIVL